MASLNASIMMISLPAIFRGIHVDPLGQGGSTDLLLWVLMSYMVATAVLVVAFGRLGDMFGRTKLYNLGFLIFTVGSIALSLTPGHGTSAVVYIIIMRFIQGIGGALLFANSTAILTDAFPATRRGLALGINGVAAIAGTFIGLLVGGLLADVHWRLVFWVSVPIGIFATIWAYAKLEELFREKKRQSLDLFGNLAFAIGLVFLLIGINFGIQPYGGHVMGWTSPRVISFISLGVALLIAFFFIERKVKEPMFDLRLFKIRAFTAGNVASLFSAIGRGGLQFMLVIWLQGIWLPLHGYSFESTPLWAGIYMIPLTVGFLASGPVSGYLSDKFGARPFATGGMILGALSFVLLIFLPVNFSYWIFAVLLFVNGVGSGLFSAPNSTGIMNSVPAAERGQASGMRATTMNAGMVLSIGIFFSLMIAGLASNLPGAMAKALESQNVPTAVATQVADTPPVGSLFAAFLGYNPMSKLVPAQVLNQLPAQNRETILGKNFFPQLLSKPFMHGLQLSFGFAAVLYILAAIASWMRGKKYIAEELA